MPAERAVLDLFCDLTLAADLSINVGDVDCGTGRLAPYLRVAQCVIALSPRRLTTQLNPASGNWSQPAGAADA
ncbi:hypothetical protein [Micromonospora foliorum]|uniref:hypothetical protein n=1 Tax=Micromonospora foliorum TaxID=2911210 RepID=UPI00355748B0